MVFYDGASGGGAELVEPQRWLLGPFRVAEEFVGVQNVVAQELVRGAVQRIGARLRHHINDGRRAVPVLSGHVQGEFLEFLDDVGVRYGINSAAQTFVRDAILEKSDEVRAQAVHDGAVPVFKIYAGNVDRAWSQLDQVKNVAAVQGHVGHLTSAYRLIKPRILRIDQGGAAFDGDDFCGLAQRQL